MMVLSMPTRTVPSWPASTGTAMSMTSRSPRPAGSLKVTSCTFCGQSPGTRFWSTSPGGTSGAKVWAMRVRRWS